MISTGKGLSSRQEKIAKGFRNDGTLKSQLRFSGVVRVVEISERQRKVSRKNNKEEIETFWLVVDSYGARFLCFSEALIGLLCIETVREIKGRISVSRGGTYLVIESVDEFIPSNYT